MLKTLTATRSAAALVVAAFAVPMTAHAQGWIEPPIDRSVDFSVVRERTVVTVNVHGRIAEVSVEEWFRNTGGGLGEGDYLYPLPGEAVFSNFSLFQGDQELRGETMDAREARAIYEEIVRRKRDPALIELVGHGLIRSRVFPINPGETRKITLRFTQVLERAGDALQFRYAAGGRFQDRSRPLRERATVSFHLMADGESFANPFSPTHSVGVTRRGGKLEVRSVAEITGNFSLFLPFASDAVGMTIATHRPTPGEPGFFMMTLSPGKAEGRVVSRDVSVVLDVSGSMSGSKMDQAKAALHQVLSSLGARDRFRLIAFSNRVRSHRPDWSPVTDRTLGEARDWIDGLAANGGTNIAGALAEAFRVSTPAGRLPIVLFLTDGLPSVGEKDPERIAQGAAADRRDARVFAFGVGYDVNTHLLDRLTAEGHGATQYVEPGADVEAALSRLVTKIQHPVLTDLTIADSPVRLDEIYPAELPDLFAGEELIVFGRYQIKRRDRSGDVTVSGRRGTRTEEFSAEAGFPRHELSNEFIPRLWAARKLGFLTRTIRLEGQTPELVKEVRELALEYGLLSEYTSYLVTEPEQVAGRPIDGPRLPIPATQAEPLAANTNRAARRAVGKDAVMAAEEARKQREVRFAGELNEMDDARRARSDGPVTRHVSGRLFILKENAWVDLKHADSLAVVDIAPFSDAYFALLRLAPEFEPWFAAFERVLVAGERISIRLSEDGDEEIGGADLARLVREFRGK